MARTRTRRRRRFRRWRPVRRRRRTVTEPTCSGWLDNFHPTF